MLPENGQPPARQAGEKLRKQKSFYGFLLAVKHYQTQLQIPTKTSSLPSKPFPFFASSHLCFSQNKNPFLPKSPWPLPRGKYAWACCRLRSSSIQPPLDIKKGVAEMLHPNLHHHLPPPPPLARQWVPWLVPLIFVANIVIFALEMYINDCPSRERKGCILYPTLGRFSFQPLGENPLLGPSVATLEKLGGLERKLVVEDNDGWRLISCIWLHAGVVHLATNMLSLSVNLGALYMISGFGGSLLSTLNVDHAQKISVGASGALFGLLGAMLSHVDNSAHIGGFIAGFLQGFVLFIRPQYGYVSRRYIPAGYDVKHKKSKYKCYQYFFWVLALLLLVAGFASGLAKLFNGQTVDKVPF